MTSQEKRSVIPHPPGALKWGQSCLCKLNLIEPQKLDWTSLLTLTLIYLWLLLNFLPGCGCKLSWHRGSHQFPSRHHINWTGCQGITDKLWCILCIEAHTKTRKLLIFLRRHDNWILSIFAQQTCLRIWVGKGSHVHKATTFIVMSGASHQQNELLSELKTRLLHII